MSLASALALGALAWTAPAFAQHTLGANKLHPGPIEPVLTLRPEAALRELAVEVAAVLELRTGQRVEVGEAPPPELLEAVPVGHIAMALHDGVVLLVLGGPGGRSLDAEVQVGARPDPSYARAVALAAEDLRDTAIELSRTEGVVEAALAPDAPGPVGTSPSARPGRPAPNGSAVDRAEEFPQGGEGTGLFGGGVEPLIFVRAYGGASTDSEAPASGVGAGLGLCVQRYCLVLGAELPLLLPGDSLDVRYRYPTFTSGFYSQPLVFEPFALGASLGFLTRVGHFRADMGLRDEGLDTDLGARGSVEFAYNPAAGFDVIAETGADYTIDRHQLPTGERLLRRGDRFSPWGQLALRVRL
jgi:hypothetical protein